MRMNSGSFARILLAASPLFSGLLSAQSITLNPNYISIGVGQTVQYAAQTVGLAETGLTWKVLSITGGNAIYGTISQAGLYTAPAVIPGGDITISALGSDNKTIATVYVNVAPSGPPVTSVTPSPVPTGTTAVVLTGAGFITGAQASMDGVVLTTTVVNATTIKTTVYHNATTTPGVFRVKNPGSLWGAPLSVPFVQSGPPAPQSIAPATASLNYGATQQFTSAGATGWAATAGTISATGLYTAPAALPATNPAKITVTGPGGSACAYVTIVNPNPQTLAPATVSLNLGATQQFTSAGATGWTALAGTITVTGFYTAPAALPPSGTDTVGVSGPNGTASATVTLIPPTPVITGIGGAAIPLGVFSTALTGTGFTSISKATLGNNALATVFVNATTLNVSGFAPVSGQVNLTVANGLVVSQPLLVQVGVPNAVVTAAAARRFLEQAAFGATSVDAAHVQAIGFPAWIAEQLAMPQISDYNSIPGSQQGMPVAFLTNAVTNPDQLRQRVGLALSEIFVTSLNKIIWNGDMIPYQNMLLADAFTNYRKILGDVTLSAAMGEYLDMANNAKANPAKGTVANENYAREIMQLFSIGTKLLNQDGTAQLDAANQPIPAYLQNDVAELARVFTGWTYAAKPGNQVIWNAYINSAGPMAPYASMHDTGSKVLLNGYSAAAGLTVQADLDGALTSLATHPNAAPFISKQLIQHLVRSNPSAAYVKRVADAFVQSNGDMPTVVTTILLDQEARANDQGGADLPTDGHLQEPALYLPGYIRAFNGQMTNSNYYASDMAALGQDLFNSPSVFNYFSPGYVIAGTGGVNGPEFQIHNPNASVLRENLVANFFNAYNNPIQTYGPGTTVDLTAFLALAATPATLIDALDLTLTHGTMPAAMKQIVINAVAADQGGIVHKVQTAVYLILTSNYYNVWH